MRKLAFLASFLALALASPASARLVSFDLIKGSSETPIPNGWASFDWSSGFFGLTAPTIPAGTQTAS